MTVEEFKEYMNKKIEETFNDMVANSKQEQNLQSTKKEQSNKKESK